MKRCSVCRSILKVVPQKIAFMRNDGNIVEVREVCFTCFNKYLIFVREETLPEEHKPEEQLPQRHHVDKAVSNVRREARDRKIKDHNKNFTRMGM